MHTAALGGSSGPYQIACAGWGGVVDGTQRRRNAPSTLRPPLRIPPSPPASAVQGLEIKSGRAPEITGLLQALMGKLEKDKAVLQVGGRRASVRGHSQ